MSLLVIIKESISIKTICSVLEQNYPHYEYIIIDGGSTDNTIEIIKKYQKYLTYWVSEKDKGQAHAINKGFQHATGDIFAWINSDDYYEKDAFSRIGDIFSQAVNIVLVYGDNYFLYPDGSVLLRKRIDFNYRICLYAYNMIPQPSAFFTRKAYQRAGGIKENLRYSLDYDFFLRISEFGSVYHLHKPLSYFRLHDSSKTVSMGFDFTMEDLLVRESLLGRKWTRWDEYKRVWYFVRTFERFLVERRMILWKKKRVGRS